MTLIDIIIIGIVGLAVILIFRQHIKQSKQGQCSCCANKNKKPSWVDQFQKSKR